MHESVISLQELPLPEALPTAGWTLRVAYGAASCTLFVMHGMEPKAFKAALKGQFDLANTRFHLREGGCFVDMSAGLPRDADLTLHLDEAPNPLGFPADESQPGDADLRRQDSYMMMELDAIGPERAVTGVNTLADAADKIDRFARISLDLSTERTLMAWQRTSLACIRTMLTVMLYSQSSVARHTVCFLATLTLIGACALASYTGRLRYDAIQRIIELREPPSNFGRVSLKWFAAGMQTGCCLIAIFVYTHLFII